MTEFTVGDRVLTNNNLKGTVEFTGATSFSQGVWFGVKLDLAKGKNDGSVNGKHYFKCEKNHGIFVRATQLTKLEDGQSSKPEEKAKSGLRKPTPIKSFQRSIPYYVKTAEEAPVDSVSEPQKQKTNDDAPANIESDDKQHVDSEDMSLNIRDLEEKLQTLQIKRSEDKEKLKEYEKLKIHAQQLEENKKLIQEKAAEYQRSLDKMKQDYSKLNEEFDVYKEETSSLSENIEMLTIDKEMAEEKLDGFRLQIEEMNGKIEELSLENEILKLEQKGAAAGTSDEAQVNVLKTQNARLRDAIIVMKDLSESQKSENERMNKEIAKLEVEYDKVLKEKNRLATELKGAQESIIELKEQVDGALGADEMVSTLTDKNLELEEKMKILLDEKNQMEELCDMNNEINENNSIMITDLQTEISTKNGHIQELNKALVCKNESLLDYEETIEKFRELVKDLQSQIKEFKQQAENSSDSTKAVSSVQESKIQPKGSEVKDLSEMIEIELLKLEKCQYETHTDLLLKFLPTNFFKSGNGFDSVSMIILTGRLINKIDIFINQIKHCYLEKEDEHCDVMSILYFNRLCFLLYSWYMILRHFKKILITSPQALFSRLVALYSEMSPNEKSIDYIIELMKKGHLDRFTSLEPLERSINYFNTFYQVHIVNELPDCNEKLMDSVKIFLTAANLINESCTKFMSNFDSETDSNDEFLKRMQRFSSELLSHAKNIRRNVAKEMTIVFPKDVSNTIDQCLVDLSGFVNVFLSYSNAVGNMLEEDPQLKTLPKAMDHIKKYPETKNINEVDEFFSKLNNFIEMIGDISDSIEQGKFDSYSTGEGKKKDDEPIQVMATKFKNELSELENSVSRLDLKEEELKKMKVNYKLKCDEVSEMSIRLSVNEKKLNSIIKEKDEIIERLEQKYEQTKALLARKERELDQTSEALQSDINNLEVQKDELKKQIKENRKRNFFENINNSAKNSDNNDGQYADVENLLDRMKSLRQIIHNQRKENMKLNSVIYKNQSSEMDMIVPKNKATESEFHSLFDCSRQLCGNIYEFMSSIKICKIDSSSSTSSSSGYNGSQHLVAIEKIKREFIEINKLKASLLQKSQTERLQVKPDNKNENLVGVLKFKTDDKENNSKPKCIMGSSVTISKINNYFY